MRILAIDTALGATAASVLDTDSRAILAEESRVMERGQGEALMPMVARVLDAAGLDFATIDRFAVTIGPGSFTGLRIGIAAARGFGLVHERPVVGVSTLSAYSAPVLFGGERRAVAAAIDARHGMIFFQALNRDGRPMAGPMLCPLEEAARKLGDGPVGFVGNAADRIAEARRDSMFEPRAGNVSVLPAPEIAWVARLGAVADPATAPARPLYMREVSVTLGDRARLERA